MYVSKAVVDILSIIALHLIDHDLTFNLMTYSGKSNRFLFLHRHFRISQCLEIKKTYGHCLKNFRLSLAGIKFIYIFKIIKYHEIERIHSGNH